MPKNTSINFGLRHMRHFVAVAEELHFRRAAERLNIAQPALSRSVQHLEKALGAQLLNRTNRRVLLTPAGDVFLAGCRSTLASLENAVRQTNKVSDGELGVLRIGYTDFAISGELPHLLKAFRQRYPDIHVDPVHGVTSNQIERLDDGRLDFGFLTGPILREDIETVVLQDEPFVVVLYDRHPLATKERIRLADLAQEKFILGTPADWRHYMDHLLRICRNAGFEPNMVQHAFNTEAIFGLVACEMGISVYTSTAENYLRKGLVYRHLSDVPDTLQTVCAWKEGSNVPAHETFASFVKQYSKEKAFYAAQSASIQ